MLPLNSYTNLHIFGEKSQDAAAAAANDAN